MGTVVLELYSSGEIMSGSWFRCHIPYIVLLILTFFVLRIYSAQRLNRFSITNLTISIDKTHSILQNQSLQSDLNDREDQILVYKKREDEMKNILTKKAKDREDDTKIKTQLGKRLEQVLLDKEDMKDQLKNLKVGAILIMLPYLGE